MRKLKEIPRVEVLIREGGQLHSGLTALKKIIKRDSEAFEFVDSVTLFLDGNTDNDQNEIVRTVHHLMQNVHYKIGKSIQQNIKHEVDGYSISSYIKYLSEIKIVNSWLTLIGEYWKAPEYKTKQQTLKFN